MVDEMELFSYNKPCVKCGFFPARVKYLAAQTTRTEWTLTTPRQIPERIGRVCERCDYRWSERPSDSAPSTPIEPEKPSEILKQIEKEQEEENRRYQSRLTPFNELKVYN